MRRLLKRLAAALTPEPTWENASALIGAVILLAGVVLVVTIVGTVVAVVQALP